MNHEDAAKLFALARDAYPAWDPPPSTVKSWARLLADDDVDEVERRLVALCRSRVAPPSIADLVGSIGLQPRRGTPSPMVQDQRPPATEEQRKAGIAKLRSSLNGPPDA